MLREGWCEGCKWIIHVGLLLLTTQQYSQWQIPDYGASWKWSSELGICLLKHRGSGSRYSVSFPAKGNRGHQPVKGSFSARWGERRKKGSMTLPAFRFNTVIHCEINISIRGNLVTDTVLMFSRERHFSPLPEGEESLLTVIELRIHWNYLCLPTNTARNSEIILSEVNQLLPLSMFKVTLIHLGYRVWGLKFMITIMSEWG